MLYLGMTTRRKHNSLKLNSQVCTSPLIPQAWLYFPRASIALTRLLLARFLPEHFNPISLLVGHICICFVFLFLFGFLRYYHILGELGERIQKPLKGVGWHFEFSWFASIIFVHCTPGGPLENIVNVSLINVRWVELSENAQKTYIVELIWFMLNPYNLVRVPPPKERYIELWSNLVDIPQNAWLQSYF